MFLVVLARLHAIELEFDVSWRMVSEYELGRHGWLMSAAFLAFGVSCVASVVANPSPLRESRASAGRVSLGVAAVGFMLAGVPCRSDHCHRGRAHDSWRSSHRRGGAGERRAEIRARLVPLPWSGSISDTRRLSRLGDPCDSRTTCSSHARLHDGLRGGEDFVADGGHAGVVGGALGQHDNGEVLGWQV